MKRIIFAVLLAVLAGPSLPAPVALAKSDDYRCEPIAERALKDADDEISSVKYSKDPRTLARSAGRACGLLKNAVDNMNLLMCSAEVSDVVTRVYRLSRDQLDQVNNRLGTSARCTFSGG